MFQQICRACMQEGPNLVPIGHENSQISKMLISINMEIKVNDRLPLQMCMSCVSDLNRCYSFRLKFENSENTLKSLMENVYGVVFQEEPVQFLHNSEANVQYQTTVDDLMDDDFDISKMLIPKNRERRVDSNTIIIENDIMFLIEEKDKSIERVDELEVIEEIEMIPQSEDPDYNLPEEDSVNSKLEWKCEDCGLSFIRKKNFDNHLQNFHQIDLSVGPVESKSKSEIVEIEVKSKKTIQKHTDVSVTEETTMKCIYCNKLCDNDAELKIHHKTDHPNKKYGCTKCGKLFTMLSTLKDHDRTHTMEKPFLCPSCGRAFSQSTNLKQHIRRHKQIKPFKCTFDRCNNAFVSKGELESHARVHTGDHPYTCGTCSASFTTSSTLVKHKRIHSGEKPYLCEHCNQRFSALGTLKNHVRIHSGEKPFKCTFGCGRAFRQKSDMQAHVRTHTGERPYGCDICQARFHQSGTLRTHMKIHKTPESQPQVVETAEEKSE